MYYSIPIRSYIAIMLSFLKDALNYLISNRIDIYKNLLRFIVFEIFLSEKIFEKLKWKRIAFLSLSISKIVSDIFLFLLYIVY